MHCLPGAAGQRKGLATPCLKSARPADICTVQSLLTRVARPRRLLPLRSASTRAGRQSTLSSCTQTRGSCCRVRWLPEAAPLPLLPPCGHAMREGPLPFCLAWAHGRARFSGSPMHPSQGRWAPVQLLHTGGCCPLPLLRSLAPLSCPFLHKCRGRPWQHPGVGPHRQRLQLRAGARGGCKSMTHGALMTNVHMRAWAAPAVAKLMYESCTRMAPLMQSTAQAHHA